MPVEAKVSLPTRYEETRCKQNAIKLSEEKKVDSETEEWYFSIVDVVAILTDSENPRRYWNDLKRKG